MRRAREILCDNSKFCHSTVIAIEIRTAESIGHKCAVMGMGRWNTVPCLVLRFRVDVYPGQAKKKQQMQPHTCKGNRNAANMVDARYHKRNHIQCK